MQIDESSFAHAAKLYLPIVAKLPADEAHPIMERIESRMTGVPLILPELIFDELQNLLADIHGGAADVRGGDLADDAPSLLHTSPMGASASAQPTKKPASRPPPTARCPSNGALTKAGAASESRYRGPMAMDEVEIEARAAVLVQMELGALAQPEDLADAQAAIKAGLSMSGDAEERAIRQRALDILQEASERYRSPLAGLKL